MCTDFCGDIDIQQNLKKMSIWSCVHLFQCLLAAWLDDWISVVVTVFCLLFIFFCLFSLFVHSFVLPRNRFLQKWIGMLKNVYFPLRFFAIFANKHSHIHTHTYRKREWWNGGESPFVFILSLGRYTLSIGLFRFSITYTFLIPFGRSQYLLISLFLSVCLSLAFAMRQKTNYS